MFETMSIIKQANWKYTTRSKSDQNCPWNDFLATFPKVHWYNFCEYGWTLLSAVFLSTNSLIRDNKLIQNAKIKIALFILQIQYSLSKLADNKAYLYTKKLNGQVYQVKRTLSLVSFINTHITGAISNCLCKKVWTDIVPFWENYFPINVPTFPPRFQLWLMRQTLVTQNIADKKYITIIYY
jgi:hypothetical protein